MMILRRTCVEIGRHCLIWIAVIGLNETPVCEQGTTKIGGDFVPFMLASIKNGKLTSNERTNN